LKIVVVVVVVVVAAVVLVMMDNNCLEERCRHFQYKTPAECLGAKTFFDQRARSDGLFLIFKRRAFIL